MFFDWVGHFPRGLAMTTVLFCAGFSAKSNSGVATAVTIGMLTLPEMLNAGWDRKSSFAIVASGGTFGILILPFMILTLLTPLIGIAIPVLSTWLPGTVH